VNHTVQKAQNLLDELTVEEKQGYNLAGDKKKEAPAARNKYEIADNYDDDFDDDIDEDLPEDDHV
jgi:hypothetical protein